MDRARAAENLLEDINVRIGRLDQNADEADRFVRALDKFDETQEAVAAYLLENEPFNVRLVASLKESAIPKSAILIIDDPAGCPDGWQRFGDSDGRMIIGVGSSDQSLTSRFYRDRGGAESHKLSVEQIPPHRHRLNFVEAPLIAGGRHGFAHPVMKGFPEEDAFTGTTGGDSEREAQAHNNMPPYIALYFCKKKTS